MAGLPTIEHRNQEATCYVGNLDPSCDEDLLTELFNNIGRVVSVHMPKDKLTSEHHGYGFVEFRDEIDAEYAIQILSMVKLHNRPLRVSKSSLDKKSGMLASDVGANLFIGNLDPMDCDDKLLYDTFSAFGTLIKHPKIMRDEETNQSKGYGFISYDSFESSDSAIECMNNQFLCNRQITVQYAFKKGGTSTEETGQAGGRPERHGSRAERMLAASNPLKKYMAGKKPNTLFASSAKAPPNGVPPPPMGMPPPSFMHHGNNMMNSMPPPPLPPPPPGTNGAFLPHGAPPPPPPSMGGMLPLPPPPPPPSSSNISNGGAASVMAPPPLPPPLPPQTTAPAATSSFSTSQLPQVPSQGMPPMMGLLPPPPPPPVGSFPAVPVSDLPLPPPPPGAQ